MKLAEQPVRISLDRVTYGLLCVFAAIGVTTAYWPRGTQWDSLVALGVTFAALLLAGYGLWQFFIAWLVLWNQRRVKPDADPAP